MNQQTPEGIYKETVDWAQYLGQYELAEVIGRGGMGEVYRARHRVLDRFVAIKIIRDHQPTPEKIRRFEREILALGKLSHPNIVQALDAGCINGTTFVATEFLLGANVHDLLPLLVAQPIPVACEVAICCARALEHAHQHGFIHRDVKPANVMVTWDGQIKLLDLGLVSTCRLTETETNLTLERQVLGTPDYMSPEQATDPAKVTAASDCYSLGCFIFALLTGRPPFASLDHDSIGRKILAHQFEIPRRLSTFRKDIPKVLDDTVGGMLEKHPERRPSIKHVMECLTEFADHRRFCDWVSTLEANRSIPPLQSLAASQETGLAARGADSTFDSRRSPSSLATRVSSKHWRFVPALLLFAAIVGSFVGVFFLLPQWSPQPERSKASESSQLTSPRAGMQDRVSSYTSLVQDFRLSHYRSSGSLMKQFEFPGDFPAQIGDDFRLDIEFSIPAYAYLVAFNPDGSTQLCLPEDEHAKPTEVRRLQLYPDATDYFTTVEGEGTLAFVLIASQTPLPSWRDWLVDHSIPAWGKVSSSGIWSYQDSSWNLLSPASSKRIDLTRGVRTSRNPELLLRICEAIASYPGIHEVRCLSLPIERGENSLEPKPVSLNGDNSSRAGTVYCSTPKNVVCEPSTEVRGIDWKRVLEIANEGLAAEIDLDSVEIDQTFESVLKSWAPPNTPVSEEAVLVFLRHLCENELTPFAIQLARRLEAEAVIPKRIDRPFALWAIELLASESFAANRVQRAIPLLTATVEEYQRTSLHRDREAYFYAIKLLVYSLRRDQQLAKAQATAELYISETRRLLGDYTAATVAAYAVLHEGLQTPAELETAYQELSRLRLESRSLPSSQDPNVATEVRKYQSSLAGLLGHVAHRTCRFSESTDLLTEAIETTLLPIDLRRWYSHVRIDAFQQLNQTKEAITATEEYRELLAHQPPAPPSQLAATSLTLAQIYFSLADWRETRRALVEAQMYVARSLSEELEQPSLDVQSAIRIMDARVAVELSDSPALYGTGESLVEWHRVHFGTVSPQTIEAMSVAAIWALKHENHDQNIKINTEILDLLLRDDNWKHVWARSELNWAPARIEAFNETALAGEYRARHVSLLESHPGVDSKHLFEAWSAYCQNLIWQDRFAEAELFCFKKMALSNQIWGRSSQEYLQAVSTRAVVLSYQGREQEAVDTYELIIQLCKEHFPERLESDSILWANLANSLRSLGRHAEALEMFRKATEVAIASGQKDTAWFGMLMNNRAFAHLAIGQLDEADSLFRAAIQHWETTRRGGARESEGGLAQVLFQKGDLEQSIQILENLIRQVDSGSGDPGSIRIYATLAYRALMKSGNPERAREMLKVAYQNEQAWQQAADRPFLSGGAELEVEAWVEYVTAMAATGNDLEAWQVWEQQLATKSMFEQRLRSGTEAQRQIGIQLRNRYRQMEKLHRQRLSVKSENGLPNSELSGHSELSELRLSHEIAELQWRAISGFDQEYSEPSLSVIQSRLPERSAIVGWVERTSDLGEKYEQDTRWICVIQKSGPPLWRRLPSSPHHQSLRRRLGVEAREMLAEPSNESQRQNMNEVLKHLKEVWTAPLESILVDSQGNRVIDHLFIIPIESLQGIPLDVLFHDQFITCSYTSSASFLSAILARAELPSGNRAGTPTPDATMPWLVMADPVFGSQSSPPNAKNTSQSLAVRALDAENAWSEMYFPPLPGTRNEALAIASLASRSTSVDLRLGSEASTLAFDSLVGSGELEKYEVIHIATHAVADPSYPLKSYFVLSFDSETGPDKFVSPYATNSIITADQVLFDWNLKTRLVVLSACQTGVGKYVPGEGVVGFSQSFLLAGSQSALLSLWKVDDTATALLMTKFYELLLDKSIEDEKFRTAIALHSAKQWLRTLTTDEVNQLLVKQDQVDRGVKTKRDAPVEQLGSTKDQGFPYEAPYYWAGFILTGTPR